MFFSKGQAQYSLIKINSNSFFNANDKSNLIINGVTGDYLEIGNLDFSFQRDNATGGVYSPAYPNIMSFTIHEGLSSLSLYNQMQKSFVDININTILFTTINQSNNKLDVFQTLELGKMAIVGVMDLDNGYQRIYCTFRTFSIESSEITVNGPSGSKVKKGWNFDTQNEL